MMTPKRTETETSANQKRAKKHRVGLRVTDPTVVRINAVIASGRENAAEVLAIAIDRLYVRLTQNIDVDPLESQIEVIKTEQENEVTTQSFSVRLSQTTILQGDVIARQLGLTQRKQRGTMFAVAIYLLYLQEGQEAGS